MARLIDGMGFVEKVLEDLKKQSYDDLCVLPEMSPIDPPPDLPGLRFYRQRKAGEFGGVEITVTAKKRVLLFLSFILQDGFEIFPDGHIEALNEPVPPDD